MVRYFKRDGTSISIKIETLGWYDMRIKQLITSKNINTFSKASRDIIILRHTRINVINKLDSTH